MVDHDRSPTPSDDPAAPAAADPTVFTVGATISEISTLGVLASLVLALVLTGLAVVKLRG